MVEFVRVLSNSWPAIILVGSILVAAIVLCYCQYSQYLSSVDPYSLIASIIILAVIIAIILNSCKSEAAPLVSSAAAEISRSFKSVP